MLQSEQQPPRTGMAQAIARLDAAMGPNFSSRAMGRALGASEASIRRWRRNWTVAERHVLQLAKALGLDPAQVRGYAPLPEEWPPASLVERLRGEKKAPGRPSTPTPVAAPAELARQVEELRAELERLGTLVERVSRIERALSRPIIDGAE